MIVVQGHFYLLFFVAHTTPKARPFSLLNTE